MIKKDWLILIIIFFVAFSLRVLYLPGNALTFGYDQARDALVTSQIIAGDLKILGPPASTPGLYHGVFYYYFLAPAYLVGAGSPIVVAYWTAFFNAAVVFMVGYLAWLMTKKKTAAFLVAALFAISFEATQYATWLSNPTIGIWTVPVIYLGLWLWIQPSSKTSSRLFQFAPIITAIGLGLSIQAEVFLLYHAVPVALWLWVARKKISKGQLTKFGLFLTASVSTMIVSEIKFGFKSISGVISLLGSQDKIIASKGLGDFLVLMFNQLGRVFSLNSYPGNVGYGGVLVLALIIISLVSWNKKQKISWEPFLATWLFAHLTVVSVGGTSTPFLLVGIGPAVSILLGISIYKLWENKSRALAIVLLAFISFGSVSMIFSENSKGSVIFAIQKDLILPNQFAAIDYTYNQASGEVFSVNTLTSPLWINIVWTYLYKWYGLPKYGYVPQWHGKGQEGQLDTLLPVTNDTNRYFLILEPMAGIPQRYLDETIGEEDTKSTLVEEVNFGELRVQTRERL